MYYEPSIINKISRFSRRKQMKQEINRLKIVLAEKKRTNRWLAAQLGKNEATISKWCTNTTQPSLDDLVMIAKCLEVDTKDLLHSITES